MMDENKAFCSLIVAFFVRKDTKCYVDAISINLYYTRNISNIKLPKSPDYTVYFFFISFCYFSYYSTGQLQISTL